MPVRVTNGEVVVDPPRRVGRPPSPDSRMFATIRLRVSAREHADLTARAEEAGVEIPDLIRALLWPERP